MSDHKIAPERVYALIVGVEAYDNGWKLPGPARDAMRFAAWLTGLGVPSANVRLLISQLEEPAELADLPEALRCAIRQANQHNVDTALFEDLSQQDGDVLWVFWAGHGFIDQDWQLMLPYADSRKRMKLMNLDSVLRTLKSNHLPAGRFSRQIIIGDACRVPVPPNRKLIQDVMSYGSGAPVVGRRQFVVHASRLGEPAQNNAADRSGTFSEALLTRLGGKTLDESVHELVDIIRAVRTDLEQLRAAGKSWQIPTFEIGRDWDGSSLFEDGWRAPRRITLDQPAWDELGELLGGRDLSPSTYDAYRWAFEVAGCALPPVTRLPKPDLMGIVHDLASRHGGRAMPLVLPFVRYLAERTGDPNRAALLRDWVLDTGVRLGADPIPAVPARPPGPKALHVELTPASAEDTYSVRMWLYQKKFECIWDATSPIELDTVRTELGARLATMVGGAPTALARLEFHVPFELLTEGFEDWLVPLGRRGRLVPLGHHFEVLVRCPDERTGIAGEHWLRKWKWLDAHGGTHPEAVYLLTEDASNCGKGKTLHTDDPPVCVLAPVDAAHLTDVLDDMLDGGIPIAVWPRGPDAGAAAETLLTDPADEAARLDLHELPALLRKLRAREQSGLALLWDDPHRRPASRSLA
ncbi:caspase family protein [Nocardia sp. NPDC051832]|uniref:VMAP-C domain-containing protein n=1 Tax=Nocardia sp. NPDC051832 TaxID=3155673 RepID=UPI0034278E8F